MYEIKIYEVDSITDRHALLVRGEIVEHSFDRDDLSRWCAQVTAAAATNERLRVTAAEMYAALKGAALHSKSVSITKSEVLHAFDPSNVIVSRVTTMLKDLFMRVSQKGLAKIMERGSKFETSVGSKLDFGTVTGLEVTEQKRIEFTGDPFEGLMDGPDMMPPEEED